MKNFHYKRLHWHSMTSFSRQGIMSSILYFGKWFGLGYFWITCPSLHVMNISSPSFLRSRLGERKKFHRDYHCCHFLYKPISFRKYNHFTWKEMLWKFFFCCKIAIILSKSCIINFKVNILCHQEDQEYDNRSWKKVSFSVQKI